VDRASIDRRRIRAAISCAAIATVSACSTSGSYDAIPGGGCTSFARFTVTRPMVERDALPTAPICLREGGELQLRFDAVYASVFTSGPMAPPSATLSVRAGLPWSSQASYRIFAMRSGSADVVLSASLTPSGSSRNYWFPVRVVPTP
jgi:hypothetical protein